MGIFGNSGQICSAGSRLLVERTIYDDFVARVSEFAGALRVGNVMDTETQIGPVISAIPFDDIEEVIGRANRTGFGLGSGLWTRDVTKAHRLAKAIRAGSVWINCYQAMDPAVPFGGYKMSGYGRESGKQHVEEYLNVKSVWIKTG